MKTISVANDIVPIAAGHPLVITQNGKPAGVLLSPDEYDELVYRKSFVDSIDRGLSDAENGRTYRADEIKSALSVRRSKG